MSESFEGVFPSGSWQVFDNNGSTGGNLYWDDVNCLAHAGSWSMWPAGGGTNALTCSSATYANNMDSWAVHGPFNLSDASDAVAEFYFNNASESNVDFFSWMASTNGINFSGYQVSGSYPGWNFTSFDLKSVPTLGNLTGRAQVWIAFRFASNGSVTVGKGPFVDDVVIRKFVVAQTGDLGGTVVSNVNTAVGIVGATVSLQGTSFSTTTDSTGRYQISNVPAGPYTMQVSRAGFQSFSGSVTVVALASTLKDVTLSSLISVNVGLSTVSPTSGASPTLTITYSITNNSGSTPTVLLGATISGPAVISDPVNDVFRTVATGTSLYTRSFVVPSNAPAGTYDVLLGLWGTRNPDGSLKSLFASGTKTGAFTNTTSPMISNISPTTVTVGTFPLTINGSGFNTSTAQIVVTGAGCATTTSCVVPNAALTTKTGTQIIGPVTLSNVGTFTIQIQNGSGTTLSNGATLTASAAPTLSIADVSLAEGNSGTKNFVFTVTLAAAAAPTNHTTMTAAQALPQSSSGFGIVRPKQNPSNSTAQEAISVGNMTYHGGPVQHLQKVYTIFWAPAGYSFPATYRTTNNQFVQDLSGSSYYGIASQYNDATGNISPVLAYGGSWLDTSNAFPGSTLSPADIYDEVNRARAANGWTGDANSYFQVYTPDGIHTGVDNVCGWHTTDFNITYGHIVFPAVEPAPGHSCLGEQAPFPNDEVTDNAISISGHEIMETATDPQLNGWYYLSVAGEIGDLCAWQFGTQASDGSNVTLGGHKYLVQQEWSNASAGCTLAATSTQTVTVNYATADGTATAGSDYVAQSGTLTFTAGVSTQTITVAVNGDITLEPDETFFVNLSNSTNATISRANATGTLLNDDATAPIVSAVAPTLGPTTGGTSVTITGAGFVPGATVSLGGVPASGVGFTNAMTLTATTGAHAKGVVSVVVTNPDTQSGTGANLYTYVAAPTVTTVAPAFGPTTGGSSVTITGAGFVSGATVRLGGVTAINVAVTNATTLTATTGAHAAGVVSVVVTNPDAQSGTGTNLYTYVAAPTVTAIAPTSGPSTGGTSVTITGTGFVSGASVSLGGVAAINVAVTNATTLTATTGAHAAGVVSVVVTNPDAQTGTLTNGFTYALPPTVTTQPQSQTIASGSTMTMSVVASGPPPLTYQWYQGTSGNTAGLIGGATSSSYTTPALTTTTSYWVRVSNPYGSADSNTATITVCAVMLAPLSARFGLAGGSGSAVVTTQAGCSWTPSTPAGWIVLGTGSGTGTGPMTFTVQPNATGFARSALITVVDQAFLVTQRVRNTITLADFDGDSKADVTVYRPSTGGWHVLKSGTTYTTSQSFSWGLSTDVPVPGDYDGDGRIDPAIYRPSTGNWYVMKSSTSYTTSTSFAWGLGTDVPVPGDYDGDGKTDPAIYRPSTGLWAILKSSTGYGSGSYVSWGLSTDKPLPGDYDGDGKADPAVYRPSTGGWYVLKSSTNFTTSFGVLWGLSTDVPVPGDYDGDGKVDPAVYRPSTGGWYVLKSSTSFTTSFGVSWGLSTDVPVPGDFDGDGKIDPAVYRPSTGGWYVLKSGTNYSTSMGMLWGLSTDMPILKRP